MTNTFRISIGCLLLLPLKSNCFKLAQRATWATSKQIKFLSSSTHHVSHQTFLLQKKKLDPEKIYFKNSTFKTQ